MSRLATNPRTQVQTLANEQSPAPGGAGEPCEDVGGESKIVIEAAELVAKLEVLQKMYKELTKLGVGTVVVEAEMWRLVKERMAGPTGHRLLLDQRCCDEQRLVEKDPEDVGESATEQCWRDPRLVRRLLALRKSLVTKQLAKARKTLVTELKSAAVISGPGTQSRKVWESSRKTRSSVWSREHPKHQQKVAHLVRRANNCSSHNNCRKIDKIWESRMGEGEKRKGVRVSVKKSRPKSRSRVGHKPPCGEQAEGGGCSGGEECVGGGDVGLEEVSSTSGCMSEDESKSGCAMKSRPKTRSRGSPPHPCGEPAEGGGGSGGEGGDPGGEEVVVTQSCDRMLKSRPKTRSRGSPSGPCGEPAEGGGGSGGEEGGPGGDEVICCPYVSDTERWVENLVMLSRPAENVKDAVWNDDLDDFNNEKGTAHHVLDCIEVEVEHVGEKNGPADKLRKVFVTKEEDLVNMDREMELLLKSAEECNKKWSRFKREETRRMKCKKDVENEVMKDSSVSDDEVSGVSVVNEELKCESEDVIVWGDIELSDDEMSVLKLGPGYMVVAKLESEEQRVEENVAMTKVRWTKMKTGSEEMTGHQEDREEAEAEDDELQAATLQDLLDNQSRDVISPEGESVDMGRKRATDMRGNRTVYMPGPSIPVVEAEHTTRLAVWKKVFEQYKTENCDKTGKQKVDNLTPSQSKGLLSLSKRVAKRDIIILEADKGKKFVIVDENTYLNMVEDHTKDDVHLDKNDVSDSQRILSTTAKSLANIVNLGIAHSDRNYGRCIDNCGSRAEDVPALRILPKVHKGPSAKGHLQSRPVVAAQSGVSSRAGDIMSDLLEPLVSLQSPRFEDLSTEEVLSQLEDAQKSIASTGRRDTVVGSLDVKALYPSLDQMGSARIVAKFVRESPHEVNNIDWRHAQVFIASNMDPHELKREGLLDLVPNRLKKRGHRPGPTTDELRVKKTVKRKPEDQEPCSEDCNKPVKSKWVETDTSTLTEENKRLLLSMVVMVATRLIFRHHCYTFNGTIFRQRKGGPIGLRFTSIVARLVMDQWIKDFIASILEAGMEVHGIMKYVDDVNMVLAWVELGTRWVEGRLEHKEEWELEDRRSGRSRCSVTMEAMRTAADQIIPWLDFTVDYPELHADNTVPMLDLQVWVRHPDPLTEGHDALGWSFFEKATSSDKVLRASSAYNWRSKIVTMTMEVWRRLRNCTRQLDPTHLAGVICKFVVKLRESGYSQDTVTGVLKSGVKFYERKLRIELEGGPPVNQRSEVESLKRRRLKLGATQQWFARRRGGNKEVEKKDNSWRLEQHHQVEGGCLRGRQTLPKYSMKRPKDTRPGTGARNQEMGPNTPSGPQHPRTITTLLVPYTVGSQLKDKVQKSEDEFVALLGGGRVRIIEKGGDVLAHLLTRSDPWATTRTCGDEKCEPCKSRMWLQEQQKIAKKGGPALPKILVQKTSTHCRREGVNYCLQCLECASQGVRAVYWGESGLSARQRHGTHRSEVERGLAANPMVHHSVEVHGGLKPNYTAMIHTVEPRPLYRAVREAVQIGQQPLGPSNINRCMEWGTPRVPVLAMVGSMDHRVHPPTTNPRPEWSQSTLDQIRGGSTKRIKYWDHEDSTMTMTSSGSTRLETVHGRVGPVDHHPSKRLKVSPEALLEVDGPGDDETKCQDNAVKKRGPKPRSGGGLGHPCGRLAEGGGGLGGEDGGGLASGGSTLNIAEIVTKRDQASPGEKSRPKARSGGGDLPPRGTCAEGGGHVRQDTQARTHGPTTFRSLDIRYRDSTAVTEGPKPKDRAPGTWRAGAGPRLDLDPEHANKDKDRKVATTGTRMSAETKARTKTKTKDPTNKPSRQDPGLKVKPDTKEKVGKLPGTRRLGDNAKDKQRRAMMAWMTGSPKPGPTASRSMPGAEGCWTSWSRGCLRARART